MERRFLALDFLVPFAGDEVVSLCCFFDLADADSFELEVADPSLAERFVEWWM